MAEMAATASSGRSTSKEEVQRLVNAYFIQLTQGCGNEKCDNPKCVTGGGVKPMQANVAAAQAVVLAKERKNDVCTFLLSNNTVPKVQKVPPPSSKGSSPVSSTVSSGNSDEPMEIEPTTSDSPSPKASRSSSSGLSEEKVLKLISDAKADNSCVEELNKVLYRTFSAPDLLNFSFCQPPDHHGDKEASSLITVDIRSVRRIYEALFEIDADSIIKNLVDAMTLYCNAVKTFNISSLLLNHIIILFENPLLHSPEFLECAFPKFLSVIVSLTIEQKAALVDWYSTYTIQEITNFVSSIQQMLTISTLQVEDPAKTPLQSNQNIASSTHVLMIFYIANLVISQRNKKSRPHSKKLLSSISAPEPESIQIKNLSSFEMLLLKCGVHPSEVYETQIKLTDFVNESVNSELNMLADFKRQRARLDSGNRKILGKTFSFLDHPYILDPANRVEKLYFDNQLSMMNERHRTLFHVILTGIADIPFLLLRVDRHNLVSDTLAQLEAIAEWNPSDLRKQLRVEFKDEEGIDEGGVQKEFFQLLVEKLFDPMNGMFLYDDSNHFHWFNSDSLESEQQYHLIGILLGLAIYNNVILDVRFPMVVYNKLLGCNTVFQDLHSSHPQIARSLQSLLNFKPTDGSTFESTFMSTFSVSYTDMYSCQRTVNLKENGDQILVTMDTVQEFIELYSDWLLNKSIEKQFGEFKKGFDVVMGETNMADLFTAEEVELLVCGDKEWDFNTLEENTQYDGFTHTHRVIKYFWEVFYEFSDERKKQLLAFVTGSDRVPVGGLSKMKMVIVKNGPDSDRLPTAHTCFNALLLCEYSTKEKLKERLEKAIENGKGFGML